MQTRYDQLVKLARKTGKTLHKINHLNFHVKVHRGGVDVSVGP